MTEATKAPALPFQLEAVEPSAVPKHRRDVEGWARYDLILEGIKGATKSGNVAKLTLSDDDNPGTVRNRLKQLADENGIALSFSQHTGSDGVVSLYISRKGNATTPKP